MIPVINVIQIILNTWPTTVYIHKTVTNLKALGYSGHYTLLNIVLTS